MFSTSGYRKAATLYAAVQIFGLQWHLKEHLWFFSVKNEIFMYWGSKNALCLISWFFNWNDDHLITAVWPNQRIHDDRLAWTLESNQLRMYAGRNPFTRFTKLMSPIIATVEITLKLALSPLPQHLLLLQRYLPYFTTMCRIAWIEKR